MRGEADKSGGSLGLARKEAWLSGQREALSAALDERSLPESLGILVRTATQGFGSGTRAAFYLANQQGTALHHVVGMTPAYAKAVDGFPIGPESLSCGLAVHTGKPILTADVNEEPLWAEWRWLAAETGFRGCWSFPIHTAVRNFVGTLAIYWPQPREATAEDCQQVAMLTQVAGVIIARNMDAELRRRTEAALRESEERFRSLADNMNQLAWMCDRLGEATWYNKRWLDYTGLSFEEMKAWGWKHVHHPEHLDRVLASVIRSRENGEAWEDTFPLRGKDGEYRWFLSRAVPIRDGAGQIVRWLGTNTDVTEHKQAEETQKLLLNELNHRVKNTLAIVQAIAQRTSARTSNPAEFARSFGGRIQALARVHTLLSDANWYGTDLRELIRDQLVSASVDESRWTAWGPAVRLNPQMALHLALMLHELGTNSNKYGALSAAGGWVTISWTTDDALHLHWVERGGPAVATPTKRGFGTTLIEQSAKGQGGDARMLCEGDGITWDIRLPLREDSTFSRVPKTVSAATVSPTASPRSEAPNLSGKRFLVVEDEPLIGLDIAAALEEANAQVEGPAGTAEIALEIIERMSLDGALLDANLHGRPVDAIASALTRQKIPFVFITGHGREGLPMSFRDVAILSKPCSREQVVKAAAALVTARPDVARLRS